MTYIEDEDLTAADLQQTIREVALGGPDTAARSQVVWQVRLLAFDKLTNPNAPNNNDNYSAFLNQLETSKITRSADAIGSWKARARKPKAADQPCPTSPDSQYRGPENQLYRVEIQTPGPFLEQSDWGSSSGRPDLQVVAARMDRSCFPSAPSEGTTVTVETLGRDEHLGLKPGDLVEIVDDDYVLQNRAEPLLTVASVDPETFIVELNAAPASPVGTVATAHPHSPQVGRAGRRFTKPGSGHRWLLSTRTRSRSLLCRRRLPDRRLLDHSGSYGDGRPRMAWSADRSAGGTSSRNRSCICSAGVYNCSHGRW